MATSQAARSNGRIIFDENFGRVRVGSYLDHFIRDLVKDSSLNADILLAAEFQEQGIWDEVWIPRYAAEGWIIISQDRSKNTHGGKKGDHFHHVCVAHEVTHVVLSSSITQRKMVEKLQIIRSVWSEILLLHLHPRGSRFLLAFDGNGGKPCLFAKPTDKIKDKLKRQGKLKRPPQS